MKLIQGLSDSSSQIMVLALDDGSRASMKLSYRLQQIGWFYDLTYNNFTSLGNRLVTGPNILRQYRNLIPFGLWVETINNQEPLLGISFSNGLTNLYLLDAQDVQDVETNIFSGL